MGLTKREIDRYDYDPAGSPRQILWDDDPVGLGLRVFPTGAKSFVLSYRTAEGRKRLSTVGRYGVLTLPEARTRARRMLVGAGDGVDPLEEKRKVREALTIAEFKPIYLDRHAKRAKKSWREDDRRLKKYVVPALGHRRLDAVTTADVRGLHDRISRTAPVEANRVLALLSVMYTKAQEWEVIGETALNPAARVKFNPEQSRDRWVTPTEMPKLLAAILVEENIFVRAAFLLYLLTGLRRSELLRLRWRDVDLQRREVRIPETKANRPHFIPLSGPAVELLEELPREAGNDFIFPGRDNDHLYDLKRPWHRIRKAAGLEDVRLHDLRRTVGSWLASNGASLPLIGKVLNHSNASTTQVYARLAEDAPRNALEEHAERLLAHHRAAEASSFSGHPSEPLEHLVAQLRSLSGEDLHRLLERLETSRAGGGESDG